MLLIIQEYWSAILGGMGVTISLAGAVWAFGLILGLPLGLAAFIAPKSVGRLVQIASFALAALPALVILFWVHYPAQAMLHIVVPPFYTTLATLATLNAIFVGNIFRAAIAGLPAELEMSCLVCGLGYTQAFLRVLLPTALRAALPGLLATELAMLHMTLFGSLISVEELFRVIQRINAQEYRPVELYTLMAFLFALLCLPLAFAQMVAARRIEATLRG